MKREAAIKTSGLTKTFGEVRAVDGVDLEIGKGELFGLVGPDGAGKTTTLRLLAGIMEPTSGEAWVAGHPVSTEGERIKEKIGYMSQRFGLYEDLTVMENINFYADLYEVPRKERAERTERLLGFSNLTPFKTRLAGKLSGGMKQKLGLACALVHTPEVLLLDEPTNGVDPVSRRDFWRILYGLLKEGITIMVSTSYLDEAERSTRVALMHNGKLLAVEEPERLKRRRGELIELMVDDTRGAALLVKAVEGVSSVSVYGDRLHLSLAEGAGEEDVLRNINKGGVIVKTSRKVLPSLEDIFISMVAGDRR